MLSIGDLTPFFITDKDLLTMLLSSWTPYGLGGYSTDVPGIFILQIVARLLAFNNIIVAQQLYYLSLMPISSVTMYLFLNYFMKSNVGKFAIPIAYGVNSVTIPQFLEGGAPLLGVHATFPLLFLFLLKALNENCGRKRIRNILLASIFLGWLNPQAVFYSMPFIFALYLAEVIYRGSRKYATKSFLLVICLIAISFLLLLPAYILPISQTLQYLTSTTKTFGSYAIEGDFTKYVQHIIDFFSSHPYSTNNFIRATYALGILASFTLLIRNRRRATYFLCFLAAGISIMLFWRFNMSQWAVGFYQVFPFMILFKDLVKIHYMLMWDFLILVAIAVDEVHERISSSELLSKKRLGSGALHVIGHAATLSILSVIILSPFLMLFTYDVNPFLRDPSNNLATFLNGVSFSNMEVPKVLQDANRWLSGHRANESFFRTLWLPQHPKFISDLRVYDPHTFFTTPELTRLVLEPLVYRWTEQIGASLAQFNIKYVIVNSEMEGLKEWGEGDPKLRKWGFNYYVVGSPKKIVEILNTQKDLKLIANETNFLVYENLEFSSHVSAYDEVLLVTPLPYINATKSPIVYNYTGNLILNPSFERGVNNWGLPLKEKIVTDNSTSISGNSSLRIEKVEKGWVAVGQVVKVKGGTSYYVSGWMKIQNVRRAHLKVVFYDDELRSLGGNIIQAEIDGTRDWWYTSGVCISPQNATKAVIYLMGGWSYDNINPGVTWFDDISFMEAYYPLLSPIQNWWYVGDPTTRGPMLANGLSLFLHVP
ncbi:MAG: carbohydrate binding domain-containing protein, partial [Candidatus Bathyarchaeia archaeon]